jgi:hypothetical protein
MTFETICNVFIFRVDESKKSCGTKYESAEDVDKRWPDRVASH